MNTKLLNISVELSTGRIVTHHPTIRGAVEARIHGRLHDLDEAGDTMTDEEWAEYCRWRVAQSRGSR